MSFLSHLSEGDDQTISHENKKLIIQMIGNCVNLPQVPNDRKISYKVVRNIRKKKKLLNYPICMCKT